MKPYIGVTGFMHRAEVEAAIDMVPADSSRMLMVGVLASWKTLQGQRNNHPGRYPLPEDIGKIFSDAPRDRVLNLVHYATERTSPTDGFARQMYRAFESGGPHCHGLQLNVPTPPLRKDILHFKEAFPDAVLILQWRDVGRTMIAGESTASDFSGVLLDESGGRGLACLAFGGDVMQVRIRRMLAVYEHIRIGIAGGISVENLAIVRRLLSIYPDLSIDAESKLRTPADDLDVPLMRAYLRSAFSIVPSP